MNTITTDIDQEVAKTPAEALSAFLSAIGAGEQTRLIGLTATEWAAMDRGATLLLGVPREGMEPITAGQELLALDGWNHGDEPRMDVRRARAIVSGEPFQTDALAITKAQIAMLTGLTVGDFMDAANKLRDFCAALESERKSPLPRYWLVIPVVVVP